MLVYLQVIEEPEGRNTFQQVHDRYLGLMLYAARQVLGNGQDAGDTVQEALYAIAENILKISDPACAKTRNCVVTIVENKAIDIHRARRRRRAGPPDEDAAGLAFHVAGNAVADPIARLVQGVHPPEIRRRLHQQGADEDAGPEL